MFRAPRYFEKTDYIQSNLDTPLTFPGNGQHQQKKRSWQHPQSHFYQKLAGLVWRFCKKRGEKPVLVSWHRCYKCNSRCRNKLRNPTAREAFAWEANSWNNNPPQPLFVLQRAVWQTFASITPWVWNCAARWWRNDFPKWWNRAEDCCPEVWIVGSTAYVDIWRTKNVQWKFPEAGSMELLERSASPQL